VFTYAGLVVLRSVAQEHGRKRVASAAAEVGAYLWPRLNDPTAADAIPERIFHPLRRSLADWPDGTDMMRLGLVVWMCEMASTLSEAVAVFRAAPDVPPPHARDAASTVARLHDVAALWVALQFEARELAILGWFGWCRWVIPRVDIGTAEGARVCVGLAVAADEIARTDEKDAARLHRLHADLAELAGAVPPILWPSFAAGGEHDTAFVAPVGHG
jgi:hypothetical protein